MSWIYIFLKSILWFLSRVPAHALPSYVNALHATILCCGANEDDTANKHQRHHDQRQNTANHVEDHLKTKSDDHLLPEVIAIKYQILNTRCVTSNKIRWSFIARSHHSQIPDNDHHMDDQLKTSRWCHRYQIPDTEHHMEGRKCFIFILNFLDSSCFFIFPSVTVIPVSQLIYANLW